MKSMPKFSRQEYELLLASLLDEAGYSLRPIKEMPAETDKRTLYLRHDIDFHLNGLDGFAALERDMGVRSTYFVWLTGYYNPFLRENRSIIEALQEQGHEIGLHYDLRDYPHDLKEAEEYLEFQISLLETLTEEPIRSIVMHEPSAGHSDYFTENTTYVHPHSKRWGDDIMYVSDSCRAWRDNNLLSCFSENAPHKVLLNCHMELWMDGTIEDRLDYLTQCNARMSSQFSDSYFKERMTEGWKTHPAVELDRKRREGSTE